MPFSATTWAYKDVLSVQKIGQMSTNDDELRSSVAFLFPMLSMTGTSVGTTAVKLNTTYNSGTEALIIGLTFTLTASARVFAWHQSTVQLANAHSTGAQGFESRLQADSATNLGSGRFDGLGAVDDPQNLSNFDVYSLTGGTHTIEAQFADVGVGAITATFTNKRIGLVIIPS